MKMFWTFATVNIYKKNNFWLVICIAKDFIWTILNVIFSIFRFFFHPQIPDFQIVLSRPNIVLIYINGKLIYSAFRLCKNLNLTKLTLMTGFAELFKYWWWLQILSKWHISVNYVCAHDTIRHKNKHKVLKKVNKMVSLVVWSMDFAI